MYLKHRRKYIARAIAYAKKHRQRTNANQRRRDQTPKGRAMQRKRVDRGIRKLSRWYLRHVAKRTGTTEESVHNRLIAKRARRGLVFLMAAGKISASKPAG
jgi:hypothetical protein